LPHPPGEPAPRERLVEEIGPTVYNPAIADARVFFKGRAADLEGVGYQTEFPYWTKLR
jgi:hypothetical protein